MRGKDTKSHKKRDLGGITPAHAGKSTYLYFFYLFWWDHPRTCGEKQPFYTFRIVTLGSPPHMRGKVNLKKNEETYIGITPAHAGKRLKESLKTAIKLMKKISFHSVCYKLHIKADNPQQLYDSVHPLFQSMKQLYQAYNYPIL